MFLLISSEVLRQNIVSVYWHTPYYWPVVWLTNVLRKSVIVGLRRLWHGLERTKPRTALLLWTLPCWLHRLLVDSNFSSSCFSLPLVFRLLFYKMARNVTSIRIWRARLLSEFRMFWSSTLTKFLVLEKAVTQSAVRIFKLPSLAGQQRHHGWLWYRFSDLFGQRIMEFICSGNVHYCSSSVSL